MSEKLPTGFKCLKCKKIHYPAHGRCLNCKHDEFEEVSLPSEGTLVTYTILKAPPSGIDKHSLNLGIINLGYVHYTGQIEIEETENLQIGMKLVAKWQKVRTIDNKAVFGFVWSPP